MTDQIESLEDSKKRWVNRRRITWIMLWYFVIETAFLLYSGIFIEGAATNINLLKEIVIWSYIAQLGIIGTYFGTNILESSGKGRK